MEALRADSQHTVSKWFDENFPSLGRSTLDITLHEPAELGLYMFVTAIDVARRDPTSWTLSELSPDGSYHVIDSVSNYENVRTTQSDELAGSRPAMLGKNMSPALPATRSS